MAMAFRGTEDKYRALPQMALLFNCQHVGSSARHMGFSFTGCLGFHYP